MHLPSTMCVLHIVHMRSWMSPCCPQCLECPDLSFVCAIQIPFLIFGISYECQGLSAIWGSNTRPSTSGKPPKSLDSANASHKNTTYWMQHRQQSPSIEMVTRGTMLRVPMDQHSEAATPNSSGEASVQRLSAKKSFRVESHTPVSLEPRVASTNSHLFQYMNPMSPATRDSES
jgi:hypothetical protein